MGCHQQSCVDDAADVICCLLPGAMFYDIVEKFKWLYGFVESFDTLMQEFYRIVQGKMRKARHLFSIWKGPESHQTAASICHD